MTLQPTAEVSSALENLKFIPSVILREKLIRTIEDINKLIVSTESFPPEPELTTIVNRFFKYLASSCEKRSVIVRRANWILTQATIIQVRMTEFAQRHIRYSIEDYTHVQFADLVDMISTMSEKLSEYAKLYPPGDQDDIVELMEVIIETVATTKSGQDPHYYTTLESCGQRFLLELSRAIEQKRIGLQINHSGLHKHLSQFNYRLWSYRNRIVV